MDIETSKSYYHRSGNQFRIRPKVNLDLHETLPVGTYSVNFDGDCNEFYLDGIDDFKLKGKIYGDVAKTSSRIMNTFLDRYRSTGVLLVGEKGSGKTMLAQHISINAAQEKGIPTIVVNKPWHGDLFNQFIQSISQPAIILMDEFEKTYTKEGKNYQAKILTLFDGVYSSKKLFLLTCNDKSKMDSHMLNRPGRLYYLLEFHGLDQAFIREYCEDNLIRKDYIPAVVATSALFESFNFDMLKAMVQEMNRYDESPAEVLKFLNVRVDSGGSQQYVVKLIVGGKVLKSQKNWQGNPVAEVIRVYSRPDEDGDEGGGGSVQHYFSAKHLVKLDPETRRFTFQLKDKVLLLSPAPSTNFAVDYNNLTSALTKSPSEEATFVSATEEETYAAMMGDY